MSMSLAIAHNSNISSSKRASTAAGSKRASSAAASCRSPLAKTARQILNMDMPSKSQVDMQRQTFSGKGQDLDMPSKSQVDMQRQTFSGKGQDLASKDQASPTKGKSNVRLPSIKASPSRRSKDLFETVCKPQLLYSDEPDLSKLRLYFKGLSLTQAQINFSHPETKWTFLHHCAYQGDVDLLTWFLQAGADHAAANAMGKTPLHLATEANKPAAVIALLQGGANPNAKTLAGFTPLHLAVLNRHKNTVRTLLGKSSVPLDLYSESVHGTPLEMARDAEIRGMLEEYWMDGCLKSDLENSGKLPLPTPKSKRIMQHLSLSGSLEFSDSAGAAVPTPKTGKILLQPLLTRDVSGSGKFSLADFGTRNSDVQQLKAIERQLNIC